MAVPGVDSVSFTRSSPHRAPAVLRCRRKRVRGVSPQREARQAPDRHAPSHPHSDPERDNPGPRRQVRLVVLRPFGRRLPVGRGRNAPSCTLPTHEGTTRPDTSGGDYMDDRERIERASLDTDLDRDLDDRRGQERGRRRSGRRRCRGTGWRGDRRRRRRASGCNRRRRDRRRRRRRSPVRRPRATTRPARPPAAVPAQ